MKAVERTEGDRGSDGKGEGCSPGRFFEMENVLEQRLKGCHGRFTSVRRTKMFITDKRQKTSLPVLRDHVQAGTSRCDGADSGDVQVFGGCCPFKTTALPRGDGE